MLKLLAAAVAAVPLLACQTANGVPCFTLGYEQSVWALVKSPMRDFISAEVSGQMAVRQDGSFAHLTKPTSRFAVRDRPSPSEAPARAYLAARRQLIVRGTPSTDYRLPGLFYMEGLYRRSPEGAADGCGGAVAGLGGKAERLGTSKLLGEAVVNWKVAAPLGEYKVALAPALDCQILRMELTEYRYRYLPVRKELFEAKTLRRGEPDPSLFATPRED